MNEPEPTPTKKRRWPKWVIAVVVLILVGAGVLDFLEGPTLHATRPLPGMPPGTLAENLERLEGAVPGQSSWPLVQEVLHALVEPARQGLPVPGTTPEQEAEFRQYLEDNRALLPRLHTAGAMQSFGQPMDLEQYWEEQRDFRRAKSDTAGVEEAEQRLANVKTGPFSTLTPHSSNLLDLRNLVNLLVLSARERRVEGRPWEALADLEAGLGLGRQLSRRPLIIEKMIGSSLEWIAQAEFRDLAMEGAGQWSAEDLERLAASSFVQVVPRQPLRDLVLGEWWTALNVIEFVFEDGSSATTNLKNLTSLGGSSRGWRVSDLSLALHANRENTLRMMGAIHDDLLGLEAMAPADRRVYEVPESVLPRGFLANSRYALPMMMSSPAIYSSLLDSEANNRMGAEQSGVVVALLQYHAVHGEWPSTLEELVPDHLARVPIGTDSRMPLFYEITDDGPVLHSLGFNGTDDGGTGDDRVFLPVDRASR